MATYAGATFDGRIEDQVFRPYWMREKTIVRRKLGGGNSEDLQDVGFGNWFVEFEMKVSDDSGIALLQNATGLTKRTLGSLFGQNWPNVMLTKFGRPKRSTLNALWLVEVRFEYEAS